MRANGHVNHFVEFPYEQTDHWRLSRRGYDGHYEAVLITCDPEIVDHPGILGHFWINHDPFDTHGRYCDKGHEYLSAIFVANDDEPALAEKSQQKVVEMCPGKTLVTPAPEPGKFNRIKGAEP